MTPQIHGSFLHCKNIKSRTQQETTRKGARPLARHYPNYSVILVDRRGDEHFISIIGGFVLKPSKQATHKFIIKDGRARRRNTTSQRRSKFRSADVLPYQWFGGPFGGPLLLSLRYSTNGSSHYTLFSGVQRHCG
jgi:hypothetical protein